MLSLNWLKDMVFTGKSQVVLLISLLIFAAVIRVVWFPILFPLDTLVYASSQLEEPGVVLASEDKQKLLLHDNNLFLMTDELTLLLPDVVNVMEDDGFWIKTRDGIYTADLKGNIQRVWQVPKALAQAPLVGVGQGRYYLFYQEQVRVVENKEVVETYSFSGQRVQPLVEHNWQQGVVFWQGNSWTLYEDFVPQESVRVPENMGQIRDVFLAPHGNEVVFAVQKGKHTEVWVTPVGDFRPRRLLTQRKNFSQLNVKWSNSGLAVLTSLGYKGDGGLDDDFVSATLVYRSRDLDTLVLRRFQGPLVKALVPTAWDQGEMVIWFYWLHHEVSNPIKLYLHRD